jgi:hypothetical protein
MTKKYRILTVPYSPGMYKLEVKFITWHYVDYFHLRGSETVIDAAKRIVLKRRKKPKVVGEFEL